MSLIGHFCIPFSPWGVNWAYLGIVYNFNEVFYTDQLLSKTSSFPDSWFERFSAGYWKHVKNNKRRRFNEHIIDNKIRCKSINLGKFYIPLPRIIENLF